MDQVVFGRYRLIEVLGEGGMGAVYKAHDTMMNRDVAIKVLPTELADKRDYQVRFRREAQTAARLTEPHIIPIYESGEIDDRLYLVMPIIEGTDLGQLLRREGPMSPQRAVYLIEQLASALDAAHAVGLVHRDIKPSNALVTGRDFTYLIDFGIAHDAAATRLTSTGMIVGTMAYMAPERFTAGVADARSDVYALACVLYECLTGDHPFPGDSMERQIAGHLSLDPPLPSAKRPELPAGFDEVIATGMAKDPDLRYQRAHWLASAAQHALTTAPSLTAAQPTFAAPRPATAQTLAATRARPSVVEARHDDWPPLRPAPVSQPQRRTGLIVGIAAITVLAAAVAFVGFRLLQPHPPASPSVPTTQAETPSVAAGNAVKPVRATVFCSDGDADSPGTAGNVIDGDPSTSWETDVYSDPVPFPGFKNGVGLLLQLPKPTVVGAVTIDIASTGTKVEIRSSKTPNPSKLEDTTVLTAAIALKPGHNTIAVKASSPTSNLLVWISTLGTMGGKSQASISEITVQAAS